MEAGEKEDGTITGLSIDLIEWRMGICDWGCRGGLHHQAHGMWKWRRKWEMGAQRAECGGFLLLRGECGSVNIERVDDGVWSILAWSDTSERSRWLWRLVNLKMIISYYFCLEGYYFLF